MSEEEYRPICPFCECPEKTHCYFWSCPLFDNELICCDCCHNDVQKEDATTKLGEIVGKKYTREDIDVICRECAKRGL